MALTVGKIVISKAGHDEGRIYVVFSSVSEDFCLLVDGDYRKLDNPKLKRVKHCRVISDFNLELNKCSDSDIRKFLNNLKKDRAEVLCPERII